MSQNIEVPVSLGLQNAYAQVADLRKILQESVNVKSDAFRDIQRLLDKITGQADGLKGKMGEAFKTPSGSRSFLKQYEQLFSLIDIAKDKMTSLKLGDINFSGEDLEQVKNYQAELQNLQQEIDALSKGKIGNMFAGDTIANAEKVRDAIEHLHLDSSKLTFSGLSAAIRKELDSVNQQLVESENKINQYQNSIRSLNGGEYGNLQQKMQEAIAGATDTSKSTFKTENLVKYSEALEQFYNNFNQLKIDKSQAGQIIGGGKVSEFIDQEGNAIKTAADKMKEQIQSYAQALNKLEELKNAPVKKGVVKKDEAQKIADELGLTFDANAKTEVAINNLQERIREAWDKTGFNNFSEVNEYADKMLKALGESFDKADLNQYINTKQLSNQLKNIFTDAGIDLKDTNISAIFNSMSSNMDVGTFFQEAIQHMEAYKAAKEQLVSSEQANNDALKASQENLQAADQAATAGQNSSNAALEEKRNRVEEVIEALQLLAQAMNNSNRAKMNPDTSGLERGRSAINSYIESITKLQQRQKALGNIQTAVNRWMGFWQVLNMGKKAINDMKQHLQELDTVMTQIAVVTNFSQSDLWGQISQYSEIARSYGVAIKGVYEVSQIYYQQGLQQNDVMTLTTETLKMARIAGLDYATAADYMTTAIRGFKLEMTDAAHVTDVFSALAATTASSTEEIATAISKTAASAQAVGASFEATSAMMATMIATTRESATNIGTALKSVISRYGEMTSDPSKTVDSEGEEMSLNRVDKALQTVGITIHDTAGQFRDFDDVMLELMEKWDSLDSLSQRYIATLMAGNRQQSRFLALVSNVDEYKKALQTAMDSEGAGELQTLKTLDSIDAKIEKMKVTIQEFYTSSGLEEMYKNILDIITNVISAANDMPKVFGKIPVQALAVATSLIVVVKNALRTIIANIQSSLKQAGADATQTTLNTAQSMVLALKSKGAEAGQGFWQRFTEAGNGKILLSKISQIVGQAVSLAGSSLIISGANQYGKSTSIKQDTAAGRTTLGGAALSIGGSALSGAGMGAAIGAAGGPIGAVIGGIAGALEGVISNLPAIFTGFQQLNVSMERTVELAQKNAQEQKTIAQRAEGEFKSLNSAVDKFKQLEEAQYNSAEAAQNFKDYVNQLADSYPQLISSMDDQGNYIIELSTLEDALASAREKSAIATANATKAELNAQQTTADAFKEATNTTSSYEKLTQHQGWEHYQDSITSFEDMWDILWLNDSQLPQYLKKQEGESYEDATKRLYNALNPDHQIEGELKFDSRTAREVFNSLLGYQRYEEQGYAQTDLEALKKQIESMIKIDSTLSAKELTGFDSLDNLKPIEILQAYEKFNKVVSDYADYHDQVAESLTSRLVADEAGIVIAEEASNNIDDSFDYDTHKKLISSLVSQNEWAQALAESDTEEAQDFERYTKAKTQEYLNYFKEREQGLEFLENDLQLKDFSTVDELIEILQKEGQLGESEGAVGKELQDLYVNRWKKQRKDIVDLYNKQLLTIFTDEKSIPSFLKDSTKFTGTTLTAIQSDLKQYQSLIEKQQYAQAEAYLNNMEAIYGQDGIGGLSDENQTKAFSIIKDLDLSDPEALRSAAETFAEMGPKFAGLSKQFNDAALRWTTSAAILLEQLASSTQETAKSIESSISDMSKVFKYSEALEKAQTLMDANEGVKFDELFTYDKDLGGYVKSAKAFQLEMAEFQNAQYDLIEQAIDDNETILPQIEAITGQNIREQYLKDMADTSLEGDRSRWAKIQFKQHLKTVKPEATDADIDRLWIEYINMIEAYEAENEETRGEWDKFVENYLKQQGTDLAEQLKEIKDMPQQMAREALQSFDYKSVVSGKGTAQNKQYFVGLIQQAAGISEDLASRLWDLLIQGNIKEFNDRMESLDLKNLQVSQGQADRARFEAFYDAYQKIAGDESPLWNALDDETQKFLTETAGITEADYTADPAVAAQNLWAVIIEFINSGVATMNEVSESISALSNKAYGGTSKEKSYQLLDKYKDGLTSEELESLQGNQELFINTETGKLTTEAAKYLTYDNGKFVAKAGQDAASVLQFLARTLGFAIKKDTDEYKDAIKTDIDKSIADADKADIGKQRVQAWQSIMSGKVSDRISLAGVDATTKSYMKAAGLIADTSAEFVYIQSEQQLNNAIQWMQDKLSDTNWVKGNQQTARYFQSMVSDWEAKTAKNAAFEGIVGEQFNQSAAEALSMALQNTTEYSKVQSLMTKMGFKWDQAAQVWKASAESIKAAKSKITQAFAASEIDAETYTSLIASLNETANAINPKTKQDNTILDMLQNYTDATEAMKAAFITNFDPSVYTYNINKLFKANDNGTYDVDVAALKSFLDSIGFKYDEAAMSQIQAITDSYLSNIQTATTYVTQGASSLADVEAFKQSYADIVGQALDESAFQYNTLTQSFVLDPAAMSNYVNAQKKLLLGMGYTEEFVNAYIKDQTDKAIQAGIELDSFLNANTSKERNDEADKLIQQIRSLSKYTNIKRFAASLYYADQIQALNELEMQATTQEESSALLNQIEALISSGTDEMILQVLESGGQAAVDLLKQIKPDASADELGSVYSNAINRLNDALSDAEKFTKGSMINTTSKLYQVLSIINPEGINADGVITAAYDMVEVYAAIYTEMSKTAGATTAGLNDAYAKLLTAHDQVNIDITDTLKNGAGMSYADFGNLLAKYDIKFEEYLTDHWDTIILDGFGNVRIANWDAFAKDIWGDRLDQVKNTPEYTNAFKAYNDGLIELNQNIEKNIKDEILQISDAKAGDQLNFSYLWTALQNAIDDKKVDEKDINDQLRALRAVGADYVNGILTISEDANILIISDILKTLSELSGIDLGEDGQAAIRDAVDDLLKNIASLISNGAKGSLTNADATSLSQWYRSNAKNYAGAAITELDFIKTAEGLKLTETSLANVYDLMKRIDAIKADALLDDIISSRESFQSLTGALREFNDAMRLDGIDKGTNKLKGLNSALSNTAKMMQDVVQKAMTSPDSMNFMSNKLPDDIQTAVNAWENASKAIKTITAAQKSGYMGVQDFYNIVNTASSLMEAAGKTFEVASMDAATLLQKGAENVKVVDGKLTVDISSAGLNIIGSADQLKKNMATGINELASAEIAIIDAEIQVLEILAAMEQMGDMDVDIDNDGLSFEIGDIFKDNGNFTDIDDGVNNMTDYLAKLQKIVGTEGEIADAFKNFKIGTKSLYDLIHGTADEWVKVFGSQENVAKFMQKFSKGIEGWDLENNLEQQVLEFMKGLGQDYSIDLGDSGVFHVNASGISYVIDFSDEERMNAAKQAAESSGLKDKIGKTDEEFKNYLKDLVNKGNIENGKSSTLSFEENFVLKVATGQIEVVKDEKTDSEQYKVGGKLYNSKSVANAAAELIQAGAKANWEELSKRPTELGETETISGTLTVNKAEITVESDGKGNLTYKHGDYTGKSLDELYTNWFKEETGKSREENGLEFKKWQVKQGISVETVIDINGKEGNAKTNKDVRAAIQKVIDEGLPDGKITYGEENSKSIEVDIGNGVKLTIPKEKLEFENGEVIPESLQEYLRDNYNTIDLDLKDTISKAIIDAFTELSTLLTTLDSSKVSELGTAFKTVYENVQAVATGLQQLAENLSKLTGIDIKIEFNLPDLPTGGENGAGGEEPEIEIPVGGKATGTTPEAVEEELANAKEKAEEKAPEVNNAVSEKISEIDKIKKATATMANAIPDEFTNVLQIASTSQVMVEKAKFVGEGIEQGLNESQSIVEAAAEALGQVIIDKIEETATKVSESIGKIIEAIEQLKNTKLDIDVDTILTKIQTVQTAIDKLKESKPQIQVDTSEAEGKIQALKNSAKEFTTTQHISPDGEPIQGPSDFYTTQHIIHDGQAISGPSSFTTVQTIITKGGKGGCFVAGTKIYMADGTTKPIEDVYLDDIVISYNTKTGNFEPHKVVNGYTHHNTARVIDITFSNGVTVGATPSHPFLTLDGWKSRDPITSLDQHGILPAWLEIGDTVIGLYGNVQVTDIVERNIPRNFDTYDFEVDDCHTFLVEGLTVHNAYARGKAKGNATWLDSMGQTSSKGHVSGEALAGGRQKTLMGELGPELVVSAGRYFMAGQNGAEFIDLPDDAIVFNHMQTKSLMMKGQTSRGTPSTNERNAISWAKGNINGGPAMASASAALAALKQLRAMWQSLKNASISDLAGAGGGGGGGGGGGNSDKAVDPKEWVALVERWYNLTQKIAQAEKEITHEEQLRAKLQSDFTKNGQHYFKSQMASLKALKEQIAAQEQLNLSRQDYSDRRIEALRTSALGQLIDFDSNGQMLFRKDLDPSKFDGFTDAMEWRTWLTGYDEDHKARFSSQEKYEKLRAAGLIPDHVYDSNGKEITMDSDQNGEITDQEREDYFYNISKQVLDQMDEYQEAQQSLHDAIEDGKVEVLKLQEEQNKIWQEMRDNQMELEESVLEAIEDMKQREIDALEDERDKLEDSVNKYIQGLSDALDKERQMYDTEESQNELDMQKRRLAILQRSGASAADVSSLQNDILANERDLYFDAQQAQIDAIQDASDLEIARLDSQIAIMQETLDYQKEYGLLWYNVYDVMEGSAAEITSFIMRGNSEFWNLSPLGTNTRANDTLFQAEQWTGYRQELKEELSPLQDIAAWARSEVYEKDFKTYDTAMKKEFGDDYDKSGKYKKIFDQIYEETGDLTKADAAARAQYTNDKLEEEKKRKAEEEARRQAQAAAAAVAASSDWSPSNCADKCQGVCKGQLWGGSNSSGGTGSGLRGKEIPICNGNCTGSCTNSCTGGPNSKSGGYISNLPRKTSGRASGGYVTHGIYELGERGTETVLTAQQTQVLRNNILSNRPSSLISLLKTYNEGFSRMETPLTGTTTEDNSTNIDKLEFSMNVQQISNDYDARRAGEQAMNEIMRIARKTSAANSIRR